MPRKGYKKEYNTLSFVVSYLNSTLDNMTKRETGQEN